MNEESKRRWPVFIGIWATILPALALVGPMFFLAFTIGAPSGPSPEIYQDTLMARAMGCTIIAAIFLAVLQSIWRWYDRTWRIVAPHLVVWTILGAVLVSIQVIKPTAPPAPPLQVGLAGESLVVPRRFHPIATDIRISNRNRSHTKFEFSVCKDLLQATEEDCNRFYVQINENLDIGSSLPNLTAETAYHAYLREKVSIGDVVDSSVSLQLIKLHHAEKDQDAWVTQDRDGTIHRFAICGRSNRCWIVFQSRFGHVVYRSQADASQLLAARQSDEAALMSLVESWVQ